MSNVQTWNPAGYVTNAGFVAELGLPVVDLLNPVPNECLLDLGCGDGRLTEKLVAAGCQVRGVDTSVELIEAAKTRGLNVQVMDGRQLTFVSEFDAVFTNAALHWINEAEAVIEGVWQSLKPGGRFVGEFGGEQNVATVRQALHQTLKARGLDADAVDPWYFPGPTEYKERLENQGFVVSYIELIPRPTPLPGDIMGWLETFAQTFTKSLPPNQQVDFLNEIREIVRPTLCNEQGQWSVDYVRLRFFATKPNTN